MKEIKSLLILIIMLLLISLLTYANVQTYRVDLDNDGKTELVKAEQKFAKSKDMPSFATEGLIEVFSNNGNKIDSFSMPDRFDRIEFVSLNKDGIKQIVAWSSGGAHYTNLDIYGYKDGKLYKIFENGSACSVETDFKAKKPIIKVGRANWEQEDWCYASGEPLWQVYVWDEKEFIYNKELSTASELSEEKETGRFIDKVKEKMLETIDSWHTKAIELKNEGKYEEAEVLFKKILDIEPINANAHFDLGNVYFFQKRYNEALNRYKKSLDSGLEHKHSANYYYMSSLCYIGLGDNKKAITCLKKCLRINPNFENAKELLGMVKEAYRNGEKLNIEEEPIKSKVKSIFA